MHTTFRKAQSILKTVDELMNDNERIMNGEEPATESENTVNDVPQAFKTWIADNADRIEAGKRRGTLPYFIKDNADAVQSSLRSAGIFNSVNLSTNVTGLVKTKELDLSYVNDVMEKIAGGNKDYFLRGYSGVFPAPDKASYFMSTDSNGKIFINFAEKDGFDAGTSLVNAFEKIKKGIGLTEREEYSVEILWHEILHNKTKNTAVLPDVSKPDIGFQRVVAETVNQLVARRTYPDFLSKLGGKAVHREWVLENGYGYSATVNNTKKILKALNIDNPDFYAKAEKLLMKDYTDFDKKIVNLMEKMSGKDNVNDVFGAIEMKNFDSIHNQYFGKFRRK